MINHIRHKGLRRFYKTDDTRGIDNQRVKRIRTILTALDLSEGPKDMILPGLHLHQLTGNLAGYFSVSVSGNWRIVFRYENDQPTDVDLVDYH